MATYDSNSVILGSELFLYIENETSGWTPVAYSTSTSLSINGDTIDTSNKMDGVWQSAKQGKLSWTVSSENLMSDANGTGFDYFYDKMTKRVPFKIVFGRATDADGDDYDLNTAKTYYTGRAYMTSCQLTAENGSAASMSVELTGNGALEKKVGV